MARAALLSAPARIRSRRPSVSAGDRYLALHAEVAVIVDGAVPLVLAGLGEIDLERSRLARVEVRGQHGLAVRTLDFQVVRGPAVVLDPKLDLPRLAMRGFGGSILKSVRLTSTVSAA